MGGSLTLLRRLRLSVPVWSPWCSPRVRASARNPSTQTGRSTPSVATWTSSSGTCGTSEWWILMVEFWMVGFADDELSILNCQFLILNRRRRPFNHQHSKINTQTKWLSYHWFIIILYLMSFFVQGASGPRWFGRFVLTPKKRSETLAVSLLFPYLCRRKNQP